LKRRQYIGAFAASSRDYRVAGEAKQTFLMGILALREGSLDYWQNVAKVRRVGQERG